jgi:hypothetical protein
MGFAKKKGEIKGVRQTFSSILFIKCQFVISNLALSNILRAEIPNLKLKPKNSKLNMPLVFTFSSKLRLPV